MPSLKGSQTEKNIMTAFAGESQARNRYTYFAKQAKKEGFEQISAIFEETANQEKEHAKRLFKFLEGGEVQILAAFPAGVIGSTLDNLKEAAAGENHEQGFSDIAEVFMRIAVAERFHEKRYTDLAANIAAGRVFKREAKTAWRCRNCGYVHEGDAAPEKCPACDHPKAHFEMMAENW
jgi:rubrerythrin